MTVKLPEWVAKLTDQYIDGGNSCNQDVIDLREALTVAWEALESIANHEPAVWDFKRAKAHDAIERIAALGDSEKGGKA